MRKLIAILTSLVLLSSGAAILTTHAADQPPVAANTPAPTATPATATAPAAAHTAARAIAPPTTTAPAAGKPTKSAPPGAPQVPEESATIRDDPTIAPDPKQSADNNVSFPNDI
jgi:hypothetical protein